MYNAIYQNRLILHCVKFTILNLEICTYISHTSELNVHANISKQCGIHIRVNLNTYFGNAANRAET